MIRVSPTMLNDYQLFMQDVPFLQQPEFIARLTRSKIEPDSDAMLLGRCFHEVLEDPQRYGVGDEPVYEVTTDAKVWTTDTNGDQRLGEQDRTFWFDAPSMEPAFAGTQGGVWELKGEKVIETEHGLVNLVGKCDHFNGVKVRETKTRVKPFDMLSYGNAMQWRAYVYLFDAKVVEYQLVRMKLNKKLDIWFTGDIEYLPLYPYPRLVDDLRECCGAFYELVKRLGLEEALDNDAHVARYAKDKDAA